MIIETTIKTPQFLGSQNKFDYTVQKGTISTVTWIFEPTEYISGRVGMHKVYFYSEQEYLKAKIK